MSNKEARYQAQYRYAAKNLKRVPLDLRLSDYAALQAAAVASGESVNGWIKEAIKRRLFNDSSHD